ncbi:RES domain-containing protein [Paenibacillus sp. OK003]|uniref:RES domain-containing protein n=1 Tax=Paenibacillus sp. OK003 TaxID=1884380 RepID=UPI0008B70098|nr:RES domain-containing protein [Paenibacillus sp. OK003]SEL31671.1 RES domain-containing protein [Paenibacillus sp. OK003]
MSKKKLTNQDGKHQSSFKLAEQATQLKGKNQSDNFSSSDKAVTDIVGFNANHSKIADQMRIKYPSEIFNPISKAVTDIVGFNANHSKIADQMRIKYPSEIFNPISKAVTDIVGFNANHSKIADQMRIKYPSEIFTPISKAVTDIVGFNVNHFKIADQMRIKYPSEIFKPISKTSTSMLGINHTQLSTVKRAMKGIEGISWDTLNPVEKAIRGGIFDEPYKHSPRSTVTEQRIIEGRLNYQAANINFTNKLTELSQEDYSYSRIDSEDDESQLLLVSKKPNGSIIPVDEIRNAIGVMQLIGEITTEEMVAFTGHLQRYPMLGLEHKIGKLIRNSVKGLAKDVRLSGEFYRCRTRKSDEIMPWTEMEMWEAPSGISSQGRFNIEGNGFLYFSRDKDIAIMEMKQPSGTIIDIMNIKCEPRMDIKVIDITDLEVNLFKFCMFRAGDTKVKKEYLLPNFLSQCCQIENIHAIKYKSVFDHNTSNYVFFDYMRELFKYQSTMSIKT